MSKLNIYDVSSIRDGQLAPKSDVKGPVLVSDLDCTIFTNHFHKFIQSKGLIFSSPQQQVDAFIKHHKESSSLFRGIDSLVETWKNVIEKEGEIAIASSNQYPEAVKLLLEQYLIPEINKQFGSGFDCSDKITGFLGASGNPDSNNPKERNYELINQVYPTQKKVGLDDEDKNVNGMQMAGIVAVQCPEERNISKAYADINTLVNNPGLLNEKHSQLAAENIVLTAQKEAAAIARKQQEAVVNAAFSTTSFNFAASLKARRAPRQSTSSSTPSSPDTASISSPGNTPPSLILHPSPTQLGIGD